METMVIHTESAIHHPLPIQPSTWVSNSDSVEVRDKSSRLINKYTGVLVASCDIPLQFASQQHLYTCVLWTDALGKKGRVIRI